MSLTNLEKKFLETIPDDCFYEEGFDSCLWNDNFCDTMLDKHGISEKSTGGIMTSLKKKGYIIDWIDSFKLADKAIKYLLDNKIVDDRGYKIK